MADVYCTYFDSGYLTRGLALWESLTQHGGGELFVLCMDDATYDTLRRLALPGLTTVALRELEEADSGLAAVKSTRSRVEYYFTSTASLSLYILRRRPDASLVSYVDADLYFFDHVGAVRRELGDGSVGIIAHRFSPANEHFQQFGIYNVGLVMFRNDARARTVLEWWRERCLEWCYDRVEGDRFADQKYLDRWPSQFEGVVVLQHEGANVAPWNAGNHQFTVAGGRVLVDEAPLLFYHFHRLRRRSASLWQLGFWPFRTRPSRVLIDRVYRPYIAALNRWEARLDAGSAAKPLRFRPGLRDALRLPFHLASGEVIIAR